MYFEGRLALSLTYDGNASLGTNCYPELQLQIVGHRIRESLAYFSQNVMTRFRNDLPHVGEPFKGKSGLPPHPLAERRIALVPLRKEELPPQGIVQHHLRHRPRSALSTPFLSLSIMLDLVAFGLCCMSEQATQSRLYFTGSRVHGFTGSRVHGLRHPRRSTFRLRASDSPLSGDDERPVVMKVRRTLSLILLALVCELDATRLLVRCHDQAKAGCVRASIGRLRFRR